MYFQFIVPKHCQSPPGEREMTLFMSHVCEGILTQLFGDSEAAQCYLLALTVSTYIHSSVHSFCPSLIFPVTDVSSSVHFRVTVWYQ